MKKNFSHIKERIKQIAENKGVPIGLFFKEIGVSPSGFTGEKLKKGVNSETIQNLFSMYPDIDLHWLITGEKKNTEEAELKAASEPEEGYGLKNEISHLKELIKAKDETIAILKHQLGINGGNGSSKAS